MNIERGDYLTDLLSSVNPGSSVIVKDKSVRELRDDAESLSKVRGILEQFEKSQSPLFQQHAKEHVQFVKSLSKGQRLALNSLFLTYRKNASSLFDYQQINDCLDILAYYLGMLKVTVITRDFKTSRRLMGKFIAQDDTKLTYVLEKVKEFEENIKYFRLSYLNIISTLSGYLELEDKANLQFKNISALSDLNKKQKQLLHQIGKQFTSISKQLLKDKEYREFLKKN